MLKNEIDDIFVNSKNYYEDNYSCKISINCQFIISFIFLIINIIFFLICLHNFDIFFIIFSLISLAIYSLLFQNIKTVKKKYENNIHPCKEKIIIKIISGIICVFYILLILTLLIIIIIGNKDNFELTIDDSSVDETSIVIVMIKIFLGIVIFILLVLFVFMFFIFKNSFHIN